MNSIDDKYTVYSDLPGHTAQGGSSIPPELCVTSQKPDIVIIDNHMKAIHLYELTCPAERNIGTCLETWDTFETLDTFEIWDILWI